MSSPRSRGSLPSSASRAHGVQALPTVHAFPRAPAHAHVARSAEVLGSDALSPRSATGGQAGASRSPTMAGASWFYPWKKSPRACSTDPPRLLSPGHFCPHSPVRFRSFQVSQIPGPVGCARPAKGGTLEVPAAPWPLRGLRHCANHGPRTPAWNPALDCYLVIFFTTLLLTKGWILKEHLGCSQQLSLCLTIFFRLQIAKRKVYFSQGKNV